MKTPNRPKGQGIFQQHREFSKFAIPNIEEYRIQSSQAVGYRKQMNILAIIPARGGSKSIPRKNVKLLGSKPLIAYPIELAKSVPEINKIVVSTDDLEIAEIARKYGAEIPFMRPPELAQDVTPTLPVLQHAVEFLEKNQNYKADIIALLYPTNPFLQKETVQKALRTLMEQKMKNSATGTTEKPCHTVISVVEDWGRFWKKNEQAGEYFPFHPLERVNRQYYKPLLRENGAIYFSDYETIMVKNKIIDDSAVQFVVMQPGELIDLDTPDDWEEAEKKVTGQKKKVTELKIGNQRVGENHSCFIIAEAGANFRISDDPQINFQQALRLIDLAAEAKADAVKFQLYRDDKLYVRGAGHANYLGKSKSINQIIQEMELPYEWLPILKKRCDEKNIIFLCSPFDETAVEELEKIGIAAYKMASYSINNMPFLKYVASKRKPIILSTGAADEADIHKALVAIKSTGNEQIALLQCTAKYPAPLETINLQAISLLREKFGVIAGLSDHSREPSLAPLGAVALGAKIVEKHFTTDNSLPGPDHGFAILDTELMQLVKDIRNLEKCLGAKEKKVLNEEKELYEFARSRIHASQDIKSGEVFSRENIAILRSGIRERGLEPEYWEKVLGKVSHRDIPVGEPITMEDL